MINQQLHPIAEDNNSQNEVSDSNEENCDSDVSEDRKIHEKQENLKMLNMKELSLLEQSLDEEGSENSLNKSNSFENKKMSFTSSPENSNLSEDYSNEEEEYSDSEDMIQNMNQKHDLSRLDQELNLKDIATSVKNHMLIQSQQQQHELLKSQVAVY